MRRSRVTMASHHIFKVLFVNQGKVYEVYARKVSHGGLLGFVEIEELVAAALQLENAFRHPLDIEFAFEGAHLRILQARPVPVFHASLTNSLLAQVAREGPNQGGPL